VLSITGAQAFRTYRYIARAINTSASTFSLGGFQIIGTYSYAAPLLVNPRKISLLTAVAPQTSTVAQVADPDATDRSTHVVDNAIHCRYEHQSRIGQFTVGNRLVTIFQRG
jgi:hypothetical protein